MNLQDIHELVLSVKYYMQNMIDTKGWLLKTATKVL